MLIRAPKPCPVEAGLWLFSDQAEELQLLETGPESVAWTSWPDGLDAFDRRMLSAATDQLLNAAGAGREALDQALRARYPGDRRGLLEERPDQDAFWWRMATAGSLGAMVTRHLSGSPVTIDDSDDNTSVSITTTGEGGNGRGTSHPYDSRPNHGNPRPCDGGGGGGFGTSGSRGSDGNAGRSYSHNYVAALQAGSWASLRAGSPGGRGGGYGNEKFGSGSAGSAGTGIVRAGGGGLVLAHTHNGGNGGNGWVWRSSSGYRRVVGGGGGGGSGGLVVAVGGGTLSGSVSCGGGTGGSGTNWDGHYSGSGGTGGQGRVVLFYGVANTVVVIDGVLTSYQLLPALPLGGLLVM